MNPSYLDRFNRSLLTGLFVGMVTTVLCLIYNLVFREKTHFDLSPIINVASLIFFVNLLFPIIGMVFYACIHFFRRNGEVVYRVLLLLLTVLFAFLSNGAHRSDDPVQNAEFHHLLMAVVIIMGLMATALLPMLFHSKRFEEYVL